MPSQDLTGITVVALEQAVAAPYASGRLAEAGARVIKIERPDGDFARRYDGLVQEQSAYFVWLNAGKESVTLDLRDPEDAALLRRLLAATDVFIQNLAPGALGRLGLDPDALREAHPSLIVCSISGYGSSGPYRDQKAYDLLVQAESGLSAITGIGGQGTRVGVSVADISAGMTAHGEILQALFARERDPQRRGRHIEVSLFHAIGDWMNVPYLQHRYGGFTPRNEGLQHPSIAPYGAFTCADGGQILISVQNEREWQALAERVLERPELAADPRFSGNAQRVAHRSELDGLIQNILGAQPRSVVVEKLAAAKIAYGRISTLADLSRHPQNRYRTIDTVNGPVEALDRGAVVSSGDKPALAVPALGQHTERIRREFAAPTA